MHQSRVLAQRSALYPKADESRAKWDVVESNPTGHLNIIIPRQKVGEQGSLDRLGLVNLHSATGAR